MVFNNYNYDTLTHQSVETIQDSSGLVWHIRINSQCSSCFPPPSIFYAVSSKILTDDVVTLTTTDPSTEYQLTIFGMHGVNTFDSKSSLPSITPITFGSLSQVSMNTSHGGEVALAYFQIGYVSDQIGYPSGYSQITLPTSGDWFYLAFEVLGTHQTQVVTSWLVSPADNSLAIDDAMVR